MSDKAPMPAWIRRIDLLSPIEHAQLCDGYPLLPIDSSLAFDLVAWAEAKPWLANAIQPLDGARRRALREDIISRSMDKRPVLEVSSGWVADGNTRLLIYNDCRRDGIDLGFPGFEVREFEDDDARADYQVASAVVQRHLATKERKRLVRDGIRRHPEWTDNRLAVLHGLTQDTVTRISDEMILAGDIPRRPEMRLGADGREHDASRLRAKAGKPSRTPHPAEALIAAWHRDRGGHGTTSDEVQQIAAVEGISLAELAGFGAAQSERARRLAVTAWLNNLVGICIAGFVLAVVKSASGWCAFSLLRRSDVRLSICGCLRPNCGDTEALPAIPESADQPHLPQPREH